MTSITVLRRSPLFAGLEEPTLARLHDSLSGESWDARCQIMGPGESLERFRLIVSGRVKIVRSNSVDGRELTLWLLGPGDGFDVVSLLDGRPHAVSAWALTPVRTLGAPMAQWSAWLRRLRALDLAAHLYIAAKLREVEDLTTDLALHDTATRLANLLLRHFDGRQPNLLHELPQRELAAMIGSVRVVVSRLLAQMRSQGVVQLHGGAVHAVDLNRLLARAEQDIARRGPGPMPMHGQHR